MVSALERLRDTSLSSRVARVMDAVDTGCAQIALRTISVQWENMPP